mmetsp:Transcript_141035/g.351749  ORF Transcript_141035/g.351749 Transcript_141035/m.351749 type:complete len:635 (+) Transcript_141035:132-2036(+)
MTVITIQTISKELMLACRQLGHVIPETLAALVASTIINASIGSFYVERPIEEADARVVVEEAAKRILTSEKPGIATLKLQASYENAFAELDRSTKTQLDNAKSAEDRAVTWISSFTAKFDESFDTLTGLYKKIYQFLLLRCTSPQGMDKLTKDQNIEREVAAALESVFPRVGLRAFVALTGPEKTAQLQELAGIVLGIRLFNQHQKKGGVGLPTLDSAVERVNVQELLENVQKEVDEVTELCKQYSNAIVAAKHPPSGGPWDRPPSDAEIEGNRSDLLYHRQYLCYLLNLQEDISGSMERLKNDQKAFVEELTDLDALVGGRVSVPKEHVYPRFDSIARGYRTAWQEVKLLEARASLYGVLKDLRQQYFPQVPEASREILSKIPKQEGLLLTEEDDTEEPVDLDAIPGPANGDGMTTAIRLTVDNTPDFLQLPLDFQGFCIHTLVTQNRLLVPGNPALGVVKYAGRYCVFATERGCSDFCTEPDRYFGSIREVCYKHPELIHLLRIHEDFPKSSLHSIVQMTSGGTAVMQADAGTETPLHFVESNIDKTYEWNEWKMRRDALHMADIRRKTTSTTQTALSHLRRETETQVYLPKDMATNTTVSKGTNPPRFKKYHRFLRGEVQPMQVAEIKFDL